MTELLFAFVFGAVIGSFLNVVILRIPKDESIAYPSSHCFSCGNSLKPWHNIPIVSWLFLRGRCAFCNEKISMQYPAVEFISGVIFVLLISKFGVSIPIFFVALSICFERIKIPNMI
jgi:leader peptidase (prepilin peptidase)/N-methyltransferase